MTPEERARECYCERVEFIAWHIADAIRKERERCAKIAESAWRDRAWNPTSIAAAIRSTDTGEK
jgi:hypothetical protein